MKKANKCITVALMIFAASSANSEPIKNLELVSEIESTPKYVSRMFIEGDTIERLKGEFKDYAMAWHLKLNSSPNGKTMVNDADGVAYSRIRWIYNCRNRTVALKSFVQFNSAGAAVSSSEVQPGEANFQAILPRSVAEEAMYMVCRKR